MGASLAALLALQGCAPLLVGGTAATTAIVATDRRTTGEQVEDQAIELKAKAEMRRLFDNTARVQATSYAGRLLLTGDVPSEQAKKQAGEAAEQVEKVVQVVNELRAGEITPLSVRSQDTWLTSKVKTALINTKEVPSRTITVTTERGVVYLLGKVTRPESERAAKAASSVQGVNRVVKLFEIIAAESLLTDPASSKPAGTSSAPEKDVAADPQEDSGVEALPVE